MIANLVWRYDVIYKESNILRPLSLFHLTYWVVGQLLKLDLAVNLVHEKPINETALKARRTVRSIYVLGRARSCHTRRSTVLESVIERVVAYL